MVKTKKILTGLLTVSAILIFACENKSQENKKEETPKTEQKTETTTQKTEKTPKALTCTLDNDLRQSIEKAVKKVFEGNVKVVNIKNSQIPELVEVEVETPKGKRGRVLFDCDGEYMLIGKVVTITVPDKEEKGSSENGEGCLTSGIAKSKVKSVLSTIFGTELNVVEVNDTPIGSIYEVVVRDPSGKMGIMYIDCDLKHLLLANLIDIENGKSITMERQKKLTQDFYKQKEKELIEKLGEDKYKKLKEVLKDYVYQLNLLDLKNINIPNEGVIVYGNPNAKFTIYIISDPQCPFCAKLHEAVKQIAKERKDVNFKILMYPLPFHKYAKGISQNILCQADNTKRMEILDKSFEAIKTRNENVLKELQGNCPTGLSNRRSNSTKTYEVC